MLDTGQSPSQFLVEKATATCLRKDFDVQAAEDERIIYRHFQVEDSRENVSQLTISIIYCILLYGYQLVPRQAGGGSFYIAYRKAQTHQAKTPFPFPGNVP